jgi:peptidoglycan/xylan/chitin deacetylase (PgdA/CDA1 family)
MRSLWRRVFDIASGGNGDARLSILIFHRVHAVTDPLFRDDPDAHSFDALLKHVASRFRVMPLAQAVRALREGTLPSRALSITFDDGYADNLTVAAPILRRHGMSATVFVASGYLDGGWMFNDVVIEALRSTRKAELDLRARNLGRYLLRSDDDRRNAINTILPSVKYLPPRERDAVARQILREADVTLPASPMLTSDMVRALPDAGLDVGAHTVMHPILSRIGDRDARSEIAQSKEQLSRLARRDVSLFAYPNGVPGTDYGPAHVAMVRDSGFAAAVTTSPGAASAACDPFELPRFTPWAKAAHKFDVLMLRNLRVAPSHARALA